MTAGAPRTLGCAHQRNGGFGKGAEGRTLPERQRMGILCGTTDRSLAEIGKA